MEKNIIKLNESDFQTIISESVKRIMEEYADDEMEQERKQAQILTMAKNELKRLGFTNIWGDFPSGFGFCVELGNNYYKEAEYIE